MLARKIKVLSTLLLAAVAAPSVMACSKGSAETGDEGSISDTVAAGVEGSIGQPRPQPGSSSPRLSPRAQESRPLELDQMGYDQGSPDAAVRVVELSDFGCGYCRLFHQETFPTLLSLYVDTGLVQWKYVPFVLGMFPNGLEASIAAECGGEQEQFFPMQARLFSDQAGWKNSQDPFAFFAGIAEEEGLDVDRFNRCVEGGWRESRVRANIRLGREVGVRGTPTFLIEGIPISGALPLDTFRDILDVALRQKGMTPPSRGQEEG